MSELEPPDSFEDEFDDTQARAAICHDLQQSLIVEAAAGTGKTTQLVRRLVAVLRSGRTTVDRIVAVTFTRKAAGELKLRVRQELENERRSSNDGDEVKNLENAIAALEEARIGTIHSFCAELLRERPVEAGVDPDFQELSEDEAPRLYHDAFQRWVHRKLNEGSPTLRRVLTRLAGQRFFDSGSPLTRIRDAGWKLAEWRDFRHPWKVVEFEREKEVDLLVATVEAVARASARCTYRADYLRVALSPARQFTRWLSRAEDFRERDYDEVEARLVELFWGLRRDKRKGRGRFADAISRVQMLEMRQSLLDQLESFVERAGADMAAALHQQLMPIVDQYTELKRQTGALDFVDLLLKVRDLCRENQRVRGHLQQRFTHIFVDEFQDTDPLQSEILLLLSSDNPDVADWRKVTVVPGKLFLVGDPKQSIYRFRRADVLLFQDVKKVLLTAGVRQLFLSRNYRSSSTLQEAINAAFRLSMQKDAKIGQPSYIPLREYFPPIPDQPSVVVLPVPDPYGFYGIAARQVEEGQPEIVAAFLQWLTRESDWKIRDPESPEQIIPIQPRHITILFRRFLSWNRDVTHPYVRALENRSIPHVLVGSKTFHQREEVETIRAALTAIEWPDDELAVFASLKGSLFAIQDAVLLKFREKFSRLHPFEELPPDLDTEFEPVARALSLFCRLHRTRNRRPVVETVTEILEQTRAHAGFAFRPAGDQVLTNVQKICDLARAYELGGGISFRGFVERLREEAEKARSTESPIIEEGAEGVRVMTLHAAKGLESPVVVLADITANLASREPDKYVDLEKRLCAMRILGCSPLDLLENADSERDRDRAEGVRIAYVAATRARDLLIVPGVGDEEFEGWVSPLNSSLYPPDKSKRNPRVSPSLPEFGEVSVIDRPTRFDGLVESSIKPGVHRPVTGEHEVVWWDPALLSAKPVNDFGLRQETLLSPDQSGQPDTAGESYLRWKELRASTIESGSRPEFRLVAAAEAQHWPPGSEISVQVEVLERPPGRPQGKRFGTLVHTTLRDVSLAAPGEQISSLVSYHARIIQATGSETSAAVDAVSTALRHPLLLRAREAERCHRELPLIVDLEDGQTLEGSADLAFLEKGGWVVVDFKTDANLELRQRRYQRQVAWYVHALQQITGSPAQGWLLGV